MRPDCRQLIGAYGRRLSGWRRATAQERQPVGPARQTKRVLLFRWEAWQKQLPNSMREATNHAFASHFAAHLRGRQLQPFSSCGLRTRWFAAYDASGFGPPSTGKRGLLESRHLPPARSDSGHFIHCSHPHQKPVVRFRWSWYAHPVKRAPTFAVLGSMPNEQPDTAISVSSLEGPRQAAHLAGRSRQTAVTYEPSLTNLRAVLARSGRRHTNSLGWPRGSARTAKSLDSAVTRSARADFAGGFRSYGVAIALPTGRTRSPAET